MYENMSDNVLTKINVLSEIRKNLQSFVRQREINQNKA